MAQSSEAYDFSLFEPYEYGTAAPKYEPDYEREERYQRPAVKRQKKERAVSQSEKRATIQAGIKAAKLVMTVAVIFMFIGSGLYLNGKLDETARDISRIQSQIEIAKSENIRLNSKLEGMVSVDKIENYAENVLGMVKLEDYKVKYFNNDTGNKVIVSGGKTYSSSDGILGKIRRLFENIF